MLSEKYTLEFNDDNTIFEFDSIGTKGVIRKVVQYQQTNLKDYYYLGFGDMDNHTSGLDDLVITNNSDSKKVLDTVASTLFTFTDHYPKQL